MHVHNYKRSFGKRTETTTCKGKIVDVKRAFFYRDECRICHECVEWPSPEDDVLVRAMSDDPVCSKKGN